MLPDSSLGACAAMGINLSRIYSFLIQKIVSQSLIGLRAFDRCGEDSFKFSEWYQIISCPAI